MKCQMQQAKPQESSEVSNQNASLRPAEGMGNLADGQEKRRTINQRKRRKKNPWELAYYNAKSRCENKNSPYYKTYGARGIKVMMKRNEFKEVWFRDKAFNMSCPSIDRINNDGNYELLNCQYIELSENAKKDRRNRKPVMMFSLDNKFIRRFECINDANRFLGIFNHKSAGLSNHLNGRRKTYRGNIFKFNKEKV